MTESLRERCIRGMAVNDYPDLLKVAEHHLDRLLDVLEESAEEPLDASGMSLKVEVALSGLDGLLSVLRGNGE